MAATLSCRHLIRASTQAVRNALFTLHHRRFFHMHLGMVLFNSTQLPLPCSIRHFIRPLHRTFCTKDPSDTSSPNQNAGVHVSKERLDFLRQHFADLSRVVEFAEVKDNNVVAAGKRTNEGLVQTDTVSKEMQKFIENRDTPEGLFQQALGLQQLVDPRLQNLEKAATLYRASAEAGFAPAMVQYSLCLLEGLGTTRNPKEALKWMVKAAAQGDEQGLYNLGVMYTEGVPDANISPNHQTAAQLFETAAEKGLEEAQFAIGVCYLEGKGTTQDPLKAVHWLKKAAVSGHSDAMRHLADCYHDGVGVERSSAEAAKWYQQAADKGNAVAQYNLGVLYYTADGVERDLEKAVLWFMRAANQGEHYARYNLAFMLQKGEGIERNLSLAIQHMKIAADNDVEGAKEAYEEMVKLRERERASSHPSQ